MAWESAGVTAAAAAMTSSATPGPFAAVRRGPDAVGLASVRWELGGGGLGGEGCDIGDVGRGGGVASVYVGGGQGGVGGNSCEGIEWLQEGCGSAIGGLRGCRGTRKQGMERENGRVGVKNGSKNRPSLNPTKTTSIVNGVGRGVRGGCRRGDGRRNEEYGKS